MDAPLVVTLQLDAAGQARFDALRAAHFPPGRNHLAAHVTMFHALPGAQLPAVLEDVRRTAVREPFAVAVPGLRFLGRGVAYELASEELLRVRAELAAAWRPWLTAQDAQRWKPHVTVQNKVDPALARALHAELSAAPLPPAVTGTGLALWRYLGGPWEPVVAVPFEAPDPRPTV
ncbi:2'-5' RNA ligase family protein [Kineococcus glutinatus]|uniref:2'-5' RNA ligase family protein n=1 Tax=Kineococcus glutinatus TaxID=1070872 RepID=A0ABP9I0Q7_9ACTN